MQLWHHSAGQAIPDGFRDLDWTKVDLQRSEEKQKKYVISPLSFALLEGPKQCGLCFYDSTVFSEFVF